MAPMHGFAFFLVLFFVHSSAEQISFSSKALEADTCTDGDCGLEMLQLKGLAQVNDTKDSFGKPKCTGRCKGRYKELTQIVQCPGFGGSKWNIFVKAEGYVKSFGRFKGWVNPNKLSSVACGSWGSNGKNAFKFQLKGYFTEEKPNAVTGKQSYKDRNLVKTNICSCSADKKCKGGSAKDIYLKIDLKSARPSCHKPSSAEKRKLGDAPTPSRFGKRRPANRPIPRPKVYKRKPTPAYSFKVKNCKCHKNELKKFRKNLKKGTPEKCGAECKAYRGCKSFGVWKSGICMLFSKTCASRCRGGKKVKGKGNSAYNMR